MSDNVNDFYDDARSFSDSTATSDSMNEVKSKWHSAEELRKVSGNVLLLPPLPPSVCVLCLVTYPLHPSLYTFWSWVLNFPFRLLLPLLYSLYFTLTIVLYFLYNL